MGQNDISKAIIGAAIEVHKQLGPGLLESTYETCLEYELKAQGLEVKRQLPLPVVYKDVKLEAGYRIDLLEHVRISPFGLLSTNKVLLIVVLQLQNYGYVLW